MKLNREDKQLVTQCAELVLEGEEELDLEDLRDVLVDVEVEDDVLHEIHATLQ